MEDKSGKLWFGTRGDACYYDGKTFTVLRNKDEEAFYNVWGITEDRKGNIWLGGSIIKNRKGSTLFLEHGLWRYDGSTLTKVSQRGAYAMIEDKKGNIWTTGEINPKVWSLSRYDGKTLTDFNRKEAPQSCVDRQTATTKLPSRRKVGVGGLRRTPPGRVLRNKKEIKSGDAYW